MFYLPEMGTEDRNTIQTTNTGKKLLELQFCSTHTHHFLSGSLLQTYIEPVPVGLLTLREFRACHLQSVVGLQQGTADTIQNLKKPPTVSSANLLDKINTKHKKCNYCRQIFESFVFHTAATNKQINLPMHFKMHRKTH